jgi:hypothetical protein
VWLSCRDELRLAGHRLRGGEARKLRKFVGQRFNGFHFARDGPGAFAQNALRLLPQITSDHPELCVVLVDGGITQKQIASAFEAGVKDYFAEPYDIELLAERIDALCTQLSGHTAHINCRNST